MAAEASRAGRRGRGLRMELRVRGRNWVVEAKENWRPRPRLGDRRRLGELGLDGWRGGQVSKVGCCEHMCDVGQAVTGEHGGGGHR